MLLPKASNTIMVTSTTSAEYMTCYANSINLNVKFCSPTPGDGSCFYHALIEQIHRRTIIQRIPSQFQFTDHMLLRQRVVHFVRRNENTLPFIVRYRNLHYTSRDEWERELSDQEKSTTFASTVFCYAAAHLLNVQLNITTMSSTVQQPFYSINENATSGAILLLSNKTNIHFQSLIPAEDEVIVYQYHADFQMSNSFSFNNGTSQKQDNVKGKCTQIGIDYDTPTYCEAMDGKKQRIQKIKRKVSRKKYHAKNKASKMEKGEKKLEEECTQMGILYEPPKIDETICHKTQRIRGMKKRICKKKCQDKKKTSKMNQEEQQLKEECSKLGMDYQPPVDSESLEHNKERIRRIKRKIANKKYRDQKNEVKCETAGIEKDQIERLKRKPRSNKCETTNKRQKKSDRSSESNNEQPTQPNALADVHPNPQVFSSMADFESGEEKHTVATCIACKETRPVFHASYDNKSSHVNFNSWTVNKKSLCKRCKTDRSSRYKKKNGLPNKFSGHFSKEDDLGPITDQLRHNNQHFLPVPPYLKNLTSVELALVSKVTVCMQVHMLRHGMMSSKGHSISIPQRMAIARQLPQLPENVGIVVLIRKGANDSTKSYTVQRSAVENALIGLCYGSPCGGFEDKKPGTSCYTGPDHINKALKGRYFEYFPNQYYADVEILNDRLMTIPMVREQFPQLKVVEMKKDIAEEDKGPSPSQFEVPSSPNDESVTTSGITLPVEPKDADLELQGILDKLVGNEKRAAVVNWEYADDEPLSELKTPGFFAMSFPSVFVNGSCDITHNPLVKLDYNAWVQHIYFTGDGRVPNHPFLKFFLYNLSLRKQALQQGNFLVAQQLNESHISLCELQEKLQNNDDSIPRKIIKMGGNLVNTDPYWMNRRRELEALTFYRRKEVNDLPAYFTTNSMAELHWAPLINLLAKYLSVTSDTEETVIHDKLSNDISYLRRRVLENLHIVTQYFDARTKNYYHTVIKELFQCDDFYYRYEFAKSRGQIHAHGILFSKKHAKKVEEALETNNIHKSNEDRAKDLYNWLQTTDVNDNDTYSPLFTSMHPAGGEQVTDELDQTTWNPNKDGWPAPEGFQNPPEFNPLRQKVSEFCKLKEDVDILHTYLTNRVALHKCNGYCLRKKKMESKTRYCRAHFGKEDPVTKKTTGKEIHPFHASITDSSHPRYEGPRDHPRLVQHVKTHLLSWLANVDVQAIIDQDLLSLQKYIVAYACKGSVSTEELIVVYRNLLDTVDTSSSVKNVVHRLLMKIVGMIDVPAAAADFINCGGQLYHSSRKFQQIGLSGYRPLKTKKDNENATMETILDKFLSDKRRQENPTISLWDWSITCRCRSKCLKEHVPVYTGGPVQPVWPLTEDFCRLNLMIFSKGTWKITEDLKRNFETYTEAFVEFLESDDCDDALKEIIFLAKKRHDNKLLKDTKKKFENNVTSQNETSQDDMNSQSDVGSQLSQDSGYGNQRLGQMLLADLHNQMTAHHEKVLQEEVPLFTGREGFDWNQYGIQSLGFSWDENITEWLNHASTLGEERTMDRLNELALPTVNLLYANEFQRVIISLNIVKLMECAQKGLNIEPLRLLIQGTAGTGKTFVITSLTSITRRIFQRNGAIMNLAPTGSAANLLPDGATVHSTLPPLRKHKKKDHKTVQMSDYPLSDKSLKKLRQKIAYNSDQSTHKLYCLNMDERSMFSKTLLAWASHRLCEATANFDHSFGNVPIVNMFGDVGQLGPVGEKDLHVQPSKSCAPDESAGYVIYKKEFDNCVVLNETMRQKPEEKKLLDRLLRICNGNIKQQDWLDILARYEKDLPQSEREQFNHDKVLTIHETWAEVRVENRKCLAKLTEPVAIIPSTGRGRHHMQEEKQVGQIPSKSLIAVGSTVILTKNQGTLTPFGLNNGAVGKVVATLYAKDFTPPMMPTAVIVNFPAYRGPIWMEDHPTWIPITPDTGRCDSNCCSRTGIPLMPGYSVPVAKSQGMTVGSGKAFTHLRIKLQSEKFMESLSLGTSYTAFSRVETESRWALVEKIPQDRLLYINNHPHMAERKQEKKRLQEISDETVSKYQQFLEPNRYIELLKQLDEFCNDGLSWGSCSNQKQGCNCLLCRRR